MNKQLENNPFTVSAQLQILSKSLPGLLAALAVLFAASCSETEQTVGQMTIDPNLGQAVFEEPAQAAKAFALALETEDGETIRGLFGHDYSEVLSLENVKVDDVNNYLKAWNEFNTLVPQGKGKVLIAVGKGEWTLPVPITEGDSGWYFDVDEGLERILIRRIGRNELATMQAVLAYYDAQMEYAEQDRDDDGMLEYAQNFISTPGAHDGLFWEQTDEDNTISPLGPSMGDHTIGGGYHGYYYRILTAQGDAATGGAYNYMLAGKMRAGFGLVAWPMEYGESGVMSFIVSHAGIVYEKNLGEDGADVAASMTRFNPGDGWAPVKEVSGP